MNFGATEPVTVLELLAIVIVMNHKALWMSLLFAVMSPGAAFPSGQPTSTVANPNGKSPSSCLKKGDSPRPTQAGTISHDPCCPGLKAIENQEACGKPYGGYAGICAACGDGKCEKRYENSCNCPADCKK